MKGLLLKDFYTIWKGGRIFLILYVFMAAVSGVNIQNGWSYMGFWLVMMDSQTSSTFSYDHSCNWNRFALTMPVTRKDVVRSKFLLQLLIVCGSTLAYLVLAALVSLVLRTFEVKAFCNMLFAAWLVLWVVLLMGSVSTLLLFRFPPEYARLISILIYVIPACAFMGAGSVFMQEMTDNLAALPAEFSQCCCRRRLPCQCCRWWFPDCAMSLAVGSSRRKIWRNSVMQQNFRRKDCYCETHCSY